jgi:hypothetical protein
MLLRASTLVAKAVGVTLVRTEPQPRLLALILAQAPDPTALGPSLRPTPGPR